MPMAFAENHDSKSSAELGVEIMLAIAGLSGVAGLFWGIHQFRENRLDARKQTFFELVKEFDESKGMFPAKRILESWPYDYTKEKGLFISRDGMFDIDVIDWILAKSYKSREEIEKNLPEDYLKYFNKLTEEDKDTAWYLLMTSFQMLFDFFDRLAYLYYNKRISKTELFYFTYHMNEAKENQVISNYLKFYGYDWHEYENNT